MGSKTKWMVGLLLSGAVMVTLSYLWSTNREGRGESTSQTRERPVASSIVVRDAETGELRSPTPEEYRQLFPNPPADRSGAVKVETLPNGAKRMDTSHILNYSMAKLEPQGRLSTDCLDREHSDRKSPQPGGRGDQ